MTPIEFPFTIGTDASVNYFFKSACEARSNNQFASAIALYKKILASDSNHYKSLINIGVCYLKTKNKEEALKSFISAIESEKHHVAGHFNKALTYIYGENYKNAIRVFNDGV